MLKISNRQALAIALCYCVFAGLPAFGGNSKQSECKEALSAEIEANLPFNDHELHVIARAKPHFLMKALQGDISGVTTTILFAGETHKKSDAASNAGRDLLRISPVRGYEGMDRRNYFDHNVVGKAFKNLSTMYDIMGAANPEQYGWDSTIYDIQLDNMTAFMHQVLSGILQSPPANANTVSNLRTYLEDLAQNRCNPSFKRELLKVAEQLSSTATAGNLAPLEALNEIFKSYQRAPFGPPNTTWPRNVHLEAGHKPGFFEHGFILTFGTLITPFVRAYENHPETVLEFFKTDRSNSEINAARRFGNDTAEGILKATLGKDRNQTMANNLVQEIRSRPTPVILVVVGRAHVSGIIDLVQKALPQFRRVRLPEPPSSNPL